jgi:MoxR-like ATPase
MKMADRFYRVEKSGDWKKAGGTDLIRLQGVGGKNAIFIAKHQLEAIVRALCDAEFIHLSGPTGSAKTSLLDALEADSNFLPICGYLGFAQKSLRLFRVPMVCFETPGELIQRRSIRDGATYDEDSILVAALRGAAEVAGECYAVVWVREAGRVHSSAVQGGLLDLMNKGDIHLPDGSVVDGSPIGWITDSNYQAEADARHALTLADDAWKRRHGVNITLDHLPPEQQVIVLQDIAGDGSDPHLIEQVVQLSEAIRSQRAEGRMQSVVPPTLYGCLALLRHAEALPHHPIEDVVRATLLGNASSEDDKDVTGLVSRAFGLHVDDEQEETTTINVF